jgi:hypothetical protein
MTEEVKTSTRKKPRQSKAAAVKVAKEHRDQQEAGKIITLRTGVRVRVIPVAANLLDEVIYEVKDPEIPNQMIEEKGREEPNPFDKQYLKDLAEAEHERGVASADALLMFGIELMDGLPKDDIWLKKLQWFEKRGNLSFGSFDLDDELDKEFVYKKYHAVSALDFLIIGATSGMDEREIERAMRGFQSDEERSADRTSTTEESA